MSNVEEIKERLEDVRGSIVQLDSDIAIASRELARKKEELDALHRVKRQQIEYAHALDGMSRGCEHPSFEVDVSGRGSGFDTVCTECGWARNVFPVY